MHERVWTAGPCRARWVDAAAGTDVDHLDFDAAARAVAFDETLAAVAADRGVHGCLTGCCSHARGHDRAVRDGQGVVDDWLDEHGTDRFATDATMRLHRDWHDVDPTVALWALDWRVSRDGAGVEVRVGNRTVHAVAATPVDQLVSRLARGCWVRPDGVLDDSADAFRHALGQLWAADPGPVAGLHVAHGCVYRDDRPTRWQLAVHGYGGGVQVRDPKLATAVTFTDRPDGWDDVAGDVTGLGSQAVRLGPQLAAQLAARLGPSVA